MPIYEYQGFNAKGKTVSGFVDGDSLKSARLKLRRDGVYPTVLHEGHRAHSKSTASKEVNFSELFNRIKVNDLAIAMRQLATLIGAGIPLLESLGALQDQVDNIRLKRILSRVRDSVSEGNALSDSMKAHPKVFGELIINMVAAGESSGALDIVLMRLSDFLESQVKLKNKLISTLTYPVIMMGVAMLILTFLLIYVVPKITKIFDDVQITLPITTRLLVNGSALAKQWWYLGIVLILALGYLFKRYTQTPRGKEVWDKIKLNTPKFGQLMLKVQISRFSRTLSTLLASGVPLLKSMDIVKNVIENSILKKALEEASASITEGSSIADPLKQSGYFPPLLTHMIAVGERTGELEGMLLKVSEAYDNDVDNTISTLTSLLEPFMIVMMGGIVAFIVFSILMPILQLNQLAQ